MCDYWKFIERKYILASLNQHCNSKCFYVLNLPGFTRTCMYKKCICVLV